MTEEYRQNQKRERLKQGILPKISQKVLDVLEPEEAFKRPTEELAIDSQRMNSEFDLILVRKGEHFRITVTKAEQITSRRNTPAGLLLRSTFDNRDKAENMRRKLYKKLAADGEKSGFFLPLTSINTEELLPIIKDIIGGGKPRYATF